ncbi:MAG: hypothetical protein ACFCUI_14190, partial [Bernardetiaceae bacterium]
MDAEELLQLLHDPEKLSVLNRFDLNEIVRKYPSFQVPRLLLYLIDADEKTLHQVALRTSRRTVLKPFERALKDPQLKIRDILDQMHTQSVNAFERLAVQEEQQAEEPEAASEGNSFDQVEEAERTPEAASEGNFFDQVEEAERTPEAAS